jgi:molybdopterin/thiamine biosynthesis adenylyltransferase
MVIESRNSQASDKWLPLAFIFVMLVMWFLTLRPPYRLTIRDDHRVEFKSLLRTVVIASHEIKSIKAQVLQPGMAELKHERGKIQLALQFDGFYEFLGTLKKLNPDIEIRGC